MRDHLTEKGAVVTSRSPWMPRSVFGSPETPSLAMAGLAGTGISSND